MLYSLNAPVFVFCDHPHQNKNSAITLSHYLVQFNKDGFYLAVYITFNFTFCIFIFCIPSTYMFVYIFVILIDSLCFVFVLLYISITRLKHPVSASFIQGKSLINVLSSFYHGFSNFIYVILISYIIYFMLYL